MIRIQIHIVPTTSTREYINIVLLCFNGDNKEWRVFGDVEMKRIICSHGQERGMHACIILLVSGTAT